MGSSNDLDPEDVLASIGLSMLVRAGTFLGACVLGHAVGMLGLCFNSLRGILNLFTSPPSVEEVFTGTAGTLIVSFFGAAYYWFLWPWIVFFLYLASQFFLDEQGWRKWLPWLAAGQGVSSYVVMVGVMKSEIGWGIAFVFLASGGIVAGWKLIEAKWYEREMARFDAIEAQNRKKRRRKNQGDDSRTQ